MEDIRVKIPDQLIRKAKNIHWFSNKLEPVKSRIFRNYSRIRNHLPIILMI